MEQKTKKRLSTGIKDTFLERMKHDRRFELTVYGILVAAGLLIFMGMPLFQSNEAAPQAGVDTEVGDDAYISHVLTTEARLEEALTTIRGAGKVKVMLMSTDSSDPLQAESTENTSFFGAGTMPAEASKDDVIASQNGGTDTICGVIVIAEGAGDIAVRINLQNAVKTVLGIDASCIEVFEMKTIE